MSVCAPLDWTALDVDRPANLINPCTGEQYELACCPGSEIGGVIYLEISNVTGCAALEGLIVPMTYGTVDAGVPGWKGCVVYDATVSPAPNGSYYGCAIQAEYYCLPGSPTPPVRLKITWRALVKASLITNCAASDLCSVYTDIDTSCPSMPLDETHTSITLTFDVGCFSVTANPCCATATFDVRLFD